MLTAVVSKVDNQYKAITLPPMIIFENLSKAGKGTFPKVMGIKGTKGGTMKRSIAKSCCRLEFGKKGQDVVPAGQISFDNGFCQIPFGKCN